MAKHWIQGAVKHPGVEKAAAKAAGESVHSYMEAHKHSPGKAGQRARLGLRFESMKHRGIGGVVGTGISRPGAGGPSAGGAPIEAIGGSSGGQRGLTGGPMGHFAKGGKVGPDKHHHVSHHSKIDHHPGRDHHDFHGSAHVSRGASTAPATAPGFEQPAPQVSATPMDNSPSVAPEMP